MAIGKWPSNWGAEGANTPQVEEKKDPGASSSAHG